MPRMILHDDYLDGREPVEFMAPLEPAMPAQRPGQQVGYRILLSWSPDGIQSRVLRVDTHITAID